MHRDRVKAKRQMSNSHRALQRLDCRGSLARPGMTDDAYFAFSARLSRNTPCSPNMFQNHQGRFTRSGRP